MIVAATAALPAERTLRLAGLQLREALDVLYPIDVLAHDAVCFALRAPHAAALARVATPAIAARLARVPLAAVVADALGLGGGRPGARGRERRGRAARAARRAPPAPRGGERRAGDAQQNDRRSPGAWPRHQRRGLVQGHFSLARGRTRKS